MARPVFGAQSLCKDCGGPFKPAYEGQRKCIVCGVYKGKEPNMSINGYQSTNRNVANRPANRPTANRQQSPASAPQQQAAPAPARPATPDFWSTPEAQPLNYCPFLKAEEKWELSQSGDVFSIYAVRYRPEATYGPEWNVDLEWSGKYNEDGGHMFTLSLSGKNQSGVRERFMSGLRDFLSAHKGATVPAKLYAGTTKAGDTFYAIVGPNEDTTYQRDQDGTDGIPDFEDVPF